MFLRLLKVIAPDDRKSDLKKLSDGEDNGVIEYWESSKSNGGRREFNFLVSSGHIQKLTDDIQRLLGGQKDWRILETPVETTIPRYETEEGGKDGNGNQPYYGGMTREALYDQIFKGARTGNDFYILVLLSTIVAAIGLARSDISVVIGAMVIAPLLGPNLALSFGIILGEKDMIRQSVKANLTGLSLTLLISVIAGLMISPAMLQASYEYIQRTDVDFGGIVLALASGAAAVLSLTSGISSTMVGVMVAVALMPPAVAVGMAAGAGLYGQSLGALLLLAVNIICVNLAAQMVFTLKGIRPRTWYRQKKSKQAVKTSLVFWLASLACLGLVIYIRHSH